MPCQTQPHPTDVSPSEQTDGASAHKGSRRRRLWELPATSHDLLLALCFEPAHLQKLVETGLGRIHRRVCHLSGSGADILYGTVHDLGKRHALSETLDRALHTKAMSETRRLGPLRDAEALRQAWAEALAADDPASLLWPVLTHPLGADLQSCVLFEARHWVLSRARLGRTDRQLMLALQDAVVAARDECQALRQRALNQQATLARQLLAAQRELAELRGELMRERTAQRSMMQPLNTSGGPDQGRMTPGSPRSRPEATHPCLAPVVPSCAAKPSKQVPMVSSPTSSPSPAAGLAASVAGRRVLCVGGMPGAQARYRALVESAGAEFAYHDGGMETVHTGSSSSWVRPTSSSVRPAA